MEEQIEEQIAEIMASFDFETVQNVMIALGWKWDNKYGTSVPDVRRLQTKARELLHAVAADSWYIATGGLVAERDDDNTLRLSFVLCRAEGMV